MGKTVGYAPNLIDAFGGRGSSSKSHQWVAGFGGVRLPFVKLLLKNREIPLIDSARYDPTIYGTGKMGIENPLFLISFVYDVSSFITGSNLLTIKILDPGFSFLENLLLERAREIDLVGFSFSFGWKGVDDSFFRRACSVPLVILNTDFEVVPNRGVYITLHCIDQSSSLFTGSEYASWPETDTIDAVIKSVVKKYEPRLEVEVTSTATQVGEQKNMEGDSPGEYIKNLLRRASPVGGKTIYSSLVECPSSTGGKARLIFKELGGIMQPIEQYTFGRERQGEMLAFQATMNDRSLALQSGGRRSVSSVDPQTKELATQEHTSDEISEHHGPRKTIETPKTPTSHVESPESLELTTEKAKGDIQVIDWVAWEGTATVMGNTALRPFTTIYITILANSPTGQEVNLAKANDIYDMASGIWMIKAVTHQISSGTFITLLELVRNAGLKGKGKGGAPIPIKFQTVKEGAEGVQSRVLPLINEDSFNPELWE